MKQAPRVAWADSDGKTPIHNNTRSQHQLAPIHTCPAALGASSKQVSPGRTDWRCYMICGQPPVCWLQAQDRCHRIGQTREVHIYRLVSESTIEENILHKSDQKRQLDHLAIQSGGFNTDFLQKFNPRELLGIQGESSVLLCCAA